MVPNQISVVPTQPIIDEVLGHLQAIHTLLPFLVGMSTEERMRMSKPGDSGQGFIRKALELAPFIDDYLPRGLDVAEIRKDVALADALRPVMVAVSQLHEKLHDTHTLATSEAYLGALTVYRCAKDAQGTEGIEAIVKELARRFAGRPASSNTSEPEVPEPQTDAA